VNLRAAMRRENQARVAVPVSRYGKRALPDSRWTQRGAEDHGGNRADPAGRYEARAVLGGGETRAAAVPCAAPGRSRFDTPDTQRICWMNQFV